MNTPMEHYFSIFGIFIPLFDIFVHLWYLMILASQVGQTVNIKVGSV